MKVSNINNPNFFTDVSNTLEAKDIDFDKKEESNKKLKEQYKTSKTLELLDKYKALESFSIEDQKAFRRVLSNDFLSIQEVNSLTYEQAFKLQRLTFTPLGNELHIINTIKYENAVEDILAMTEISGSEVFNKSMMKTMQKIENQGDRALLISEVYRNLSNYYSSIKNKKLPLFERIMMKVNTNELISNVLTNIYQKLNSCNLSFDLTKKYKKLESLYQILENSYKEVIAKA